MKIVCDKCGAKYSIADEKVAGKIFKIRCKKCSSVLEVRGDQTGAHALDGQSASAPAPDGGWYIVVDGEQRGPLPPIELSQLFAKGSVGLDSYVWKEGFDDWKVASDVPELVTLLGGVGSGHKNETSKIETEGSTPLGAGGDLFGDNGREPTGEVDTHQGIFGDADDAETPEAEAPLAAASPEPASEPEPAATGGLAGLAGGGAAAAPARMTGQRNENSVLFSLSNLQQLATRGGAPVDSGAQAPAPAQASPSPQAAGEGSGLIDIRALAKSTTPGTQSAPSQAVDDLLSIGASGGGPTLGGPLLGPAPVESSDGNGWIKIAGAIVIVIGVVGVGFAGGMLMKSSSDEPLEVGSPTPAPSEPVAVAAAAPEPVERAPEPVAEPEAAAFEEPAEEPLDAPDFDEPAAEAPTQARRQRATPRKRRKPRAQAAAAAPAPKPEPKKRSGNLDALMDEVVGGSSSAKPAASKPKSTGSSGSLPDAPSRNDVKTALQGVSGGVKACNQGQGGTAVVDVTFSGTTGRVSRAKVASGPLKGTPTGACVEKAVKRARVPRFKQSAFKVKFPYRL